jgi:hypothetical protein
MAEMRGVPAGRWIEAPVYGKYPIRSNIDFNTFRTLNTLHANRIRRRVNCLGVRTKIDLQYNRPVFYNCPTAFWQAG